MVVCCNDRCLGPSALYMANLEFFHMISHRGFSIVGYKGRAQAWRNHQKPGSSVFFFAVLLTMARPFVVKRHAKSLECRFAGRE